MYSKLFIAGITLFLGILFFLPYNQRGVVLFALTACLMLTAMWFHSDISAFCFMVLVPVSCLLIWVALYPEWLLSDKHPSNPSLWPSAHSLFIFAGASLALMLLADRGRIWKKKIGLACFQVCCLFLLTLLYGDLAETFTNVALDHSTRHFVLPITNREWEVHMRHRSIDMEQNITVEPPAEVKDWPLPIAYDVGWFKYVWMHNAKNLCIDMGDGAWGQPWYRIEASCR